MTLSEAIRLGALLKPQAHGVLFRRRSGGTCAFGAAFDALGVLDLVSGTSLGSAALVRWPWLLTNVPHPITDYVEPAINVILKLNDVDDWTREAIADWVATIEPPSETSQPGAAVLVEIGTQ